MGKRILIEFFDEENLNNCVSQMHYNYDKVYCLRSESQKSIYEIELTFNALKVFNTEKLNLEYSFVEVKNDSTAEITERISEIVNDEDSFDIDITGGPEPFSYAAGVFVREKKPGNVRVHRFDFDKRVFRVMYPDYKTVCDKPLRFFTVNKLIRLQASSIKNKYDDSGTSYKPDLDKDGLRENVIKLWKIAKKYPDEWKSFLTLPKGSESNLIGNNHCSPGDIIKLFPNNKDSRFKPLLDELVNGGLIKLKSRCRQYVIYSLNIPEYQDYLFKKSGTAFEMYSYHTALSTGRFVDCSVGVKLDWDGVIKNNSVEVDNEIDLILSDGFRLFCVSCKDCDIDKQFLYEIASLTRWYGGEYAKPVILSTVTASPAIKKRAEESEIILIDNIAGISDAEFKKQISGLLRD